MKLPGQGFAISSKRPPPLTSEASLAILAPDLPHPAAWSPVHPCCWVTHSLGIGLAVSECRRTEICLIKSLKFFLSLLLNESHTCRNDCSPDRAVAWIRLQVSDVIHMGKIISALCKGFPARPCQPKPQYRCPGKDAAHVAHLKGNKASQSSL